MYISSLVGLPVVHNGSCFGKCCDFRINNKNKSVNYVILNTNNEILELPLDRIKVQNGMLFLK